MRFFISYARQNRQEAESLVRRIERLGHESWLDSKLDGGQAWWNEILAEIRGCDAFVFVLSQASTESAACSSEREYAAALGKHVIPVAVAHVRSELLPTDVSGIQMIDYTTPSEDAAFELAKSIARLPAAVPAPDPLPDPPPVPTSYLGELGRRVTAPTMTRDEQLSVVTDLKQGFQKARNQNDAEDYGTALDLLSRLEERPDLLAVTAEQIKALRAEENGRPPLPAQAQPEPQAQPQPQPESEAQPQPQPPPEEPPPPQIQPPPPSQAEPEPPRVAAKPKRSKRSKLVTTLAVIGAIFVLLIAIAIASAVGGGGGGGGGGSDVCYDDVIGYYDC